MKIIHYYSLFFICVLRYYLIPRWEFLLRLDVWGLAAGQIIFSLSPGMGTVISLASFNDAKYDGILADFLLIAASNSCFSLFGGLVVFSVVGLAWVLPVRAPGYS